MQINHIFVVSENDGREADDLVEAGLIEGSNRIHPGQGTRNRKFYFENFFLEIIWMNNESELKSPETRETGLWERINFREMGYSPFGICLDPTPDTKILFEDAYTYHPGYIPSDTSFDIIHNEKSPWLPWVCRLPSVTDPARQNEPIIHKAGLKKLTGIRIGIPEKKFMNTFTERLESGSDIIFEHTPDHCITLGFDYNYQGKNIHIDSLSMVILF